MPTRGESSDDITDETRSTDGSDDVDSDPEFWENDAGGMGKKERELLDKMLAGFRRQNREPPAEATTPKPATKKATPPKPATKKATPPKPATKKETPPKKARSPKK